MTSKTHERNPKTGWELVWEGDPSTAEAALEVLENNGLRCEIETVREARVYVPPEDADTARELLKDWAL